MHPLVPPPQPLTSFIGRGTEIAALRARLAGPERFITVLGPGGIGKSRLAAEVLRDQPGVAWCALDRAHTLDDLRATVAASLGLDGAQADPCVALRTQGVRVLVLDNVEQVVEAVAAELTRWLAAAPDVRLLLTSRARVHLGGESIYRLGPMGLGNTGDAVRLFVARGRAQVPDFSPDAPARAAVEQLVARLDGNPLAIELAAARLAWLSPAALLARIDRRFELLKGQRRDLDGRQRTLYGAIEWSWQLLSADDRAALVRCAACRGWFGLDLAEALLSDPFGQLEGLVDQSMLRVSDVDGARRFGFFESIQAFVLQAAAPAAREEAFARHRAWVLERGAALAAQVHGCRGPQARRDLLALRDELMAVVDRTRETAPVAALAALAALQPVVTSHGPLAPQLDALEAIAPHLPPAEAAHARLLQGEVLRLQGRLPQARALLEQAVVEATGARRAEAQCAAGIAAHEAGALDVAEAHYLAAMEGFGTLDDARGLGRASGSLAILAEARGQIPEAQTRYEQALDRLRQAGDARSEAIFLINLGDLHLQADRVAEAEARYARALDLLDALDDRRVRAVLLGNLGAVEQRAGRLDAAIARRTEAIEGLEAVGDQRLAAIFLGYRGAAHHEAGAEHRAAALADYDHAIGTLMQMGDDRFTALFSAHRAALHGDEGRLAALADHSDPRVAAVVAIHRGERVNAQARGIDLAFARRLRGDAQPTEAAALKVSPEIDWLQAPGEPPRDIRRRHTLRRLLRAFVNARQKTPGTGLPMDALITAGWPDERILPHAAANRVYVAIATLRKLGLRDVLISHEDGYLLDPATPLVQVPRPA